MSGSPEVIARHDHRVGEGPIWHTNESCLYWVEITSGQIFKYDPATGSSTQVVRADCQIGGFTFQSDGSMVCCMDGGRVAIWDDGEFTTVIDEIPAETVTRFNDVIADPEGRIFGGTMPTDTRGGRLYRIEHDGTYQRVGDHEYAIPNGMGFSPGLDTFYVTESEKRTIYRFDYDQDTGEVANREPFIEVPHSEGEGVPDGLTVDSEGNIWSARWGGAKVVKYSKSGDEIESIPFPVPKVSSVTFGGDEFSDLYATTAKGHDAEDVAPAGSVFKVKTAATGRPEFRSHITLQ